MKMHTKSTCDYANIDDKPRYQLKQNTVLGCDIDEHLLFEKTNLKASSKTNKLMLEMTKEYKNTWRIINMDNWFSGIVNAIDMSKGGIYVRATIRSNRRGMAKCTVFINAEITKYGRGNFRYASEPAKKIVSLWLH